MKISIESISYRLLYYRYKQYFIFIVVFLVSIILFFYAIIPLGQEYFSIRAEEERYRQKNAILQNNITFINSLPDATLDEQFNTASYALSTHKDFVGVVNSISVAAEKSGVTLSDFSFDVGVVSTTSAVTKGSPDFQIDINVQGNLEGTKKFLDSLYVQLPMVEVSSVEINGTNAVVKTSFPYKAYVLKKFDYDIPFTQLSSNELETLNSIQQWYINSNVSSFADTVEEASGSGSFVNPRSQQRAATESAVTQ